MEMDTPYSTQLVPTMAIEQVCVQLMSHRQVILNVALRSARR